MTENRDVERVLRLYPEECRPQSVEPVISELAFSGAKLWRIAAPRGPLCLRRWPVEHPSIERLEFIQAVLWHVDQEGFSLAPLPLETQHHHGYVRHNGHLWELTPWLPGIADYRANPNSKRLKNAVIALAEFHTRTQSFPLPETFFVASPGILERGARLAELQAGLLANIRSAIDRSWPDLAARAARAIERFEHAAPRVARLLKAAAECRVAIQPCIRDVWHAHILYQGDTVSGIVDFGSMRPENVAADLARLVGSMAGDDVSSWQQAIEAYQTVRKLTPQELLLIEAFDASTVLMGPLQWLRWIYLDKRAFDNPQAILDRIDELLARLVVLSEAAE